MAEYIEREAVLNRLCQENCDHDYVKDKCQNCYVSAFIEYAPAADVVPVVHGEWVQVIHHVEFEDGFVDRLYECCSRCHKSNGRKTSDYCPNCGARMDGE